VVLAQEAVVREVAKGGGLGTWVAAAAAEAEEAPETRGSWEARGFSAAWTPAWNAKTGGEAPVKVKVGEPVIGDRTWTEGPGWRGVVAGAGLGAGWEATMSGALGALEADALASG